MKKPKIKVCGLASAEDTLAVYNLGIEALGFIVGGAHPSSITLEKAEDIFKQLPEDAFTVVGVGKMEMSELKKVIESLQPKVLQLQKMGTLKEIQELKRSFPSLIIWKVIFTGEEPDLFKIRQFENAADNVLVHTKVHQWETAKQIVSQLEKPYILAGGLTLANIPEAVKVFQPEYIDLIRAVESEPGKKDPEKIRNLIKIVDNLA